MAVSNIFTVCKDGSTKKVNLLMMIVEGQLHPSLFMHLSVITFRPSADFCRFEEECGLT